MFVCLHVCMPVCSVCVNKWACVRPMIMCNKSWAKAMTPRMWTKRMWRQNCWFSINALDLRGEERRGGIRQKHNCNYVNMTGHCNITETIPERIKRAIFCENSLTVSHCRLTSISKPEKSKQPATCRSLLVLVLVLVVVVVVDGFYRLQTSGPSPGHVTLYLYLSFSSGLHVSHPDMLDI